MYNRYIPQDGPYTPVEPSGRAASLGDGAEKRKQQLKQLLKRLRLDRLDSGDLLLLLVVLLLWREEEDNDLLLALGAALLMGDGT